MFESLPSTSACFSGRAQRAIVFGKRDAFAECIPRLRTSPGRRTMTVRDVDPPGGGLFDHFRKPRQDPGELSEQTAPRDDVPLSPGPYVALARSYEITLKRAPRSRGRTSPKSTPTGGGRSRSSLKVAGVPTVRRADEWCTRSCNVGPWSTINFHGCFRASDYAPTYGPAGVEGSSHPHPPAPVVLFGRPRTLGRPAPRGPAPIPCCVLILQLCVASRTR